MLLNFLMFFYLPIMNILDIFFNQDIRSDMQKAIWDFGLGLVEYATKGRCVVF